jgi:hypothetical protein
MRQFIKKLFHGQKQVDKNEDERGKYMPAPDVPTDEKFMMNFKENGGKFLYCDSEEELKENFKFILDENNWFGSKAFCFDPGLKKRFETFNIEICQHSSAEFFIGNCEYLVANTGAVLVTSDQIKEKKLFELPQNFIIIAKTSQLVDTIGEGLHGIKSKKNNQIPTNITTLKTFEGSGQEEGNFLNYGSTSKNLYLLLLEDL